MYLPLTANDVLTGASDSELATTMHELEAEKSALISDPDKLVIIFREMIQMCLWYAKCSLFIDVCSCTHALALGVMLP